MAFAFRPVRVDPITGEKIRVRKWYARWKDPATGKWVTRAGYQDRRATKAMADRLERDAQRRHEGLPVADPRASRPIREWLTEHLAALRHKGDSPSHVALTEQRLTDLISGCGWQTAAQINPDDALTWLAEQRHAEGEENPKAGTGHHRRRRFGIATSNHYLRRLKGFTRWLVRKRVLQADPLVHTSLISKPDERHVRRVLTPEEFDALLVSTRFEAPRYQSMLTGPQRWLLYWTAAYTGLRASELASLTPASMDLQSDPPTVTIAAASEKARRGAVLPLQADLAAALREYVAGKPKTEPLWPGRWARDNHGAKMLRRDLERAGVPYRTDAGVFDFHALRLQFITSLARSGVGLAAAQRLARHGDPRITANVYTKLGLGDLADAVDKLPPPRSPKPRRPKRKP